MNLLSAEKLAKTFGEKQLFSDLNFGLAKGEKVALIAPNGSGKSTLLSILAGIEKPDQGKVVYRKDIRIGFLQQDAAMRPGTTIADYLFESNLPGLPLIRQYEEMAERLHTHPNDESASLRLLELAQEIEKADAWNIESTVKQVLGKLGIQNLDQPSDTLSGGQKKRLQLAKLLIAQPDVMILDEPTNHLDQEVTEWLENWLDNSEITLLMVTHDRYFLDGICTKILELDEGILYNYNGNFEYFLEKKTEREISSQAALEKNLNLYRRELEWVRKMPKARGTKSKSRVQAFDALGEKVRRKKTEDPLELNIKMNRVGGKVLELKKVYKNFGDLHILRGFDYTFKTGERIGIVGKNGTGKSTFLNVILGLEPPDSGKINPGETIVFGYYTQTGLVGADQKKVIDLVKEIADVIETADGTKVSASRFLQLFRFPPEKQNTLIGKLSGGEKRRLCLLTVLVKNPNFLILDEPTNDLDLLTMLTLEDFLRHYKGCLLVVSHDRYFLNAMVDHLFVFEGNGSIKDFPGTYSEYREWMEKNKKTVSHAPEKNQIASGQTKNNQKLSFKEKRELDLLGSEIAHLESEKAALTKKMSEGDAGHEQIYTWAERLREIEQFLEEKTTRWFVLSEKEAQG